MATFSSMFHLLRFLLLVATSWCVEGQRQERLVLDKEQDLAQVVGEMQKEITSLRTEIRQLGTFRIRNTTALKSAKYGDMMRKCTSPFVEVVVLLSEIVSFLLKGTGHIRFGQGATYTRWGRTVCPGNGTNRVYQGFTAGNFFTETGGAADYLCLTSEPIWGAYDDADQTNTVPIYGAEYQFKDSYSDGGAKFFGQDLHQHDAPCAVCHTSRPVTLMIPGRNICFPGWMLEYQGYLVSGRYSDPSASNYICLDSQTETEFGDVESKNGKLIQLVEAACGTLKCPPYIQNREITCVVCSK